MAKSEKAKIYVTSDYLSKSTLMPSVEGLEEVLFEVELAHFIQVGILSFFFYRTLVKWHTYNNIGKLKSTEGIVWLDWFNRWETCLGMGALLRGV